MMVDVEGRESEEGKNNCLRGIGGHLEEVFDGRVRLLRNVCLYILLHRDTAEHDRHNAW